MRTVPMAYRYTRIMGVLNTIQTPLSAYEISRGYIKDPTSSDVLTTGTILKILSLAGIVERHETLKGKSIRTKYQLRKP